MVESKIKTLILFAALYVSQSESRRKNSGKPAFCKAFNCPTVEDPVCVQLVQPGIQQSGNATSGQRVVTMKFINKCEYKYMQCYPSIRGKVVEASLCDSHGTERRSGGRRRVRRSICASGCRRQDDAHAEPMVCARCKHDFYKTFLSQCHLREFACNHPEEAMTLAARRACVFTGPQFHDEKGLAEHRNLEEENNENRNANEEQKSADEEPESEPDEDEEDIEESPVG